MLAIKTVMAGKDGTQTLIFDEIDAGISGRTAQLVGEKLKQLSCGHPDNMHNTSSSDCIYG